MPSFRAFAKFLRNSKIALRMGAIAAIPVLGLLVPLQHVLRMDYQTYQSNQHTYQSVSLGGSLMDLSPRDVHDDKTQLLLLTYQDLYKTHEALETALGEAGSASSLSALNGEALIKAERSIASADAIYHQVRELAEPKDLKNLPTSLDTTSFEALRRQIALFKQSEESLRGELIALSGQKADAALFNFLFNLAVALALIGATVAATAWISATITRPLFALKSAVQKLADGHADTDIPATAQQDEIGDIARTILVFKRQEEERARLDAERKDHQAAQEQRTQAIENHIADFDQDIHSILETMGKALGALEASSQAMAETAGASSAQAQTINQSADDASRNVDAVADAADQLARSVKEILTRMAESQNITREAADAANDADAAMRRLADMTSKIGGIVDLITDIAEQTNLLALNATIEAARAGEAGKGFAVVAAEVKSLASQTAQATNQIREQIAELQDASDGAGGNIKTVSGIQSRTSEIAGAIASALEQQSAATSEISHNVRQAATKTQDVSGAAATVSGAAEEASETANSVRGTADSLGTHAEALREQIENFLAKIRAA